jgi:hypothetical protein
MLPVGPQALHEAEEAGFVQRRRPNEDHLAVLAYRILDAGLGGEAASGATG